jgi:predicted AAA+ superfamily ATPase
MIKRELASYLAYISRYFPVISVTGPRQSGKTTLIRSAFPNHEYCNLEDPVQREFALNDPRAFLKNGTVNSVCKRTQQSLAFPMSANVWPGFIF